MAEPVLSVIIVNYNAGPMLAACVRAVMLSDVSLEVVVVDNHSADDSISLLEADKTAHVTILRNDDNLGFSRAVNQAAIHARAPNLLLLNPDCIVTRPALAGLLATIEQNKEAGIVGGLLVNLDGSEQGGCRRNEPTPFRSLQRVASPLLSLIGVQQNSIDRTRLPLPEKAQQVDAVSGAFLLISSALLRQIGGMDEGYFLHCEDLDLCRRVRDCGRTVCFQPGALAIHFKSASAGTSRIRVERFKHRGMLRYYEKFYAAKAATAFRVLIWLAVWGRWCLLALLEPIRRFRESRDAEGQGDPRLILAQLENLLRDTDSPWLIVTGASSQVGDYLLSAIAPAGFRVLAITRGQAGGRIEQNVWWVRPSLPELLFSVEQSQIAAWIHLAPVWTLAEFEKTLRSLRPGRIIAVSSSSIESKKNSAGNKDQGTVALLNRGETLLRRLAPDLNARFTIFRPTLIYGNKKNRNVQTILKFVKIFRFFPLVGTGCGKRQPVHAGDIAQSCINVIDKPSTFDKIYTLAGGEVIEFKQLVCRVFEYADIKPRFLSLPRTTLRACLSLLMRLPGLGFLTPDMADRMDQDLKFDCQAAIDDFDYEPQKFTLTRD